MNTHGQLTIGGHHGNRLRCIVYFSTSTCICSCNLSITNREKQGFSLASAIGHSPKLVPDVREFAVQFEQFVRDDFQKRILNGNAQ